MSAQAPSECTDCKHIHSTPKGLACKYDQAIKNFCEQFGIKKADFDSSFSESCDSNENTKEMVSSTFTEDLQTENICDNPKIRDVVNKSHKNEEEVQDLKRHVNTLSSVHEREMQEMRDKIKLLTEQVETLSLKMEKMHTKHESTVASPFTSNRNQHTQTDDKALDVNPSEDKTSGSKCTNNSSDRQVKGLVNSGNDKDSNAYEHDAQTDHLLCATSESCLTAEPKIIIGGSHSLQPTNPRDNLSDNNMGLGTSGSYSDQTNAHNKQESDDIRKLTDQKKTDNGNGNAPLAPENVRCTDKEVTRGNISMHAEQNGTVNGHANTSSLYVVLTKVDDLQKESRDVNIENKDNTLGQVTSEDEKELPSRNGGPNAVTQRTSAIQKGVSSRNDERNAVRQVNNVAQKGVSSRNYEPHAVTQGKSAIQKGLSSRNDEQKFDAVSQGKGTAQKELSSRNDEPNAVTRGTSAIQEGVSFRNDEPNTVTQGTSAVQNGVSSRNDGSSAVTQGTSAVQKSLPSKNDGPNVTDPASPEQPPSVQEKSSKEPDDTVTNMLVDMPVIIERVEAEVVQRATCHIESLYNRQTQEGHDTEPTEEDNSYGGAHDARDKNRNDEDEIHDQVVLQKDSMRSSITQGTMSVSMGDSVEQYTIKAGLKKNRVQLVQSLDVNKFEHLLPQSLKQLIDGGSDRRAKARAILDKLARVPDDQCKEFANIFAGLHPSLFEKVAGRPPNDHELDFCVSELSSQLRASIVDEGHKPDLSMDEKICLNEQFVELLLIDDTESASPCAHPQPDKYQAYLSGTTSNTNYRDILPTGCMAGVMVLLRGRAGIGKTTLVQWLLREWAQERWAQEKSCAFMLNLRYLLVHHYRVSLSDLLTMCSLYCPGGRHPQLNRWMQNCQQKLIFFLDGIDELPELRRLIDTTRRLSSLEEEATCLEWCINILRRDVLRDATKIVSSRPFPELHHLEPDRTIELLGLSEERVNEFITKNVPEEKRENVQAALTINPILRSVCSITFYASMLCKVLREETEAVRLNISTYTQVTAFLVLKGAARNKGRLPNPGPMGMAQELADLLPALATLARRGLQAQSDNPRLVFDQGDITRAGIKKEQQKLLEQMNLLVSKVVKHKEGEDLYAQLLHLSFQEILAMADLLQNDRKGISKAVSKMSATGRFNMAQLFLMGLALDSTNEWINAFTWAAGYRKDPVQGQSQATSALHNLLGVFKRQHVAPWKKIKGFLQVILKDENRFLQAIQGAFEAQSEELAKMAAKTFTKKEELTLRHVNLTAVDVSSLIFVMKHVDGPKVLKLLQVTLDTHSRKLLGEFLCSSVGTEVLALADSGLKMDEILHWITILSKRKMPLSIRIPTNHFSRLKEGSVKYRDGQIKRVRGPDICPLLKNVVTFKNVPVLELGDCGVTDKGAAHLATVLRLEDCKIQILNLNGNDIGDAGVQELSDALKTNTSLKTLRLSDNMMTNNGVLALAEATYSHPQGVTIRASSRKPDVNCSENLKCFQKDSTCISLESSGLTDVGAAHLAEILKSKECKIESLKLWNNAIGPKGAQQLSAALSVNKTLTDLSLYNNRVGPEGALYIAKALEKNDTLTKLDLWMNNLTNEGAAHLADSLKVNHSLQILDLRCNEITDLGAVRIATCVQNNSSLRELHLWGNDLTWRTQGLLFHMKPPSLLIQF